MILIHYLGAEIIVASLWEGSSKNHIDAALYNLCMNIVYKKIISSMLIMGQTASGKSTYAKYSLDNKKSLKYLKTITTRHSRSEDEHNNSMEYIFATNDQYKKLQSISSNWDHDIIHGNSYGVDIEMLDKNSNYILCTFPDMELIDKIKNKYPFDVKTIFIDAKQKITEGRILFERPTVENNRIDKERLLESEKIKNASDYVFTPENNIEKDTVAFYKLLEKILQ